MLVCWGGGLNKYQALAPDTGERGSFVVCVTLFCSPVQVKRGVGRLRLWSSAGRGKTGRYEGAYQGRVRSTMKYVARCHVVVCLFFVVLIGRVWAQEIPVIQPGPGPWITVRIAGRLTDFQNAPIGGATIGLATWDSAVWRPFTRSSAFGRYEVLVQLQPGTYRIIAAFGVYEVESSKFEIRSTAEANLTINLQAWEFQAKSDEPPKTTPRVASTLPRGSFSPPPSPSPRLAMAPPLSLGPGYQEFVNVFYVTNRVGVAGQPAYYLDRPVIERSVSYGVCTVSIPPTHKPGRLERPSIWRFERVEDVSKDIVITDRKLIPSELTFRARLRAAFTESGSEAFLFIHGYNVRFDDAVRRTAQLFRDLRFDGVPILFSWPGQDAWWRYPAAEDMVDTSARQLEYFLLNTLANERLAAVNVIAHSLGNRVLIRALERLALRQAQNARFNNIVLAAPDINVADFDAVTQVLQSSAFRTTIYSSSKDVALLISKVFHSYPRLGEAPPVRLSARIDTIDASAMRRDILGHSYFGDSATALRDLFLLLKQGLDPPKRFLQRRVLGGLPYWSVPAE
jgi:esterase/lipase superfamily enzyme